MLKGIEEQTGIHYCMSSALYWLILFMLTSDGTSDSVNRFCQTVHFKPAQKRFAVFLRNAVVADIQTCQISLKRSSKNIQFIMVFILCVISVCFISCVFSSVQFAVSAMIQAAG